MKTWLDLTFFIFAALSSIPAQAASVRGEAGYETTGYTRALFHSVDLQGEAETSGKALEAKGQAQFFLMVPNSNLFSAATDVPGAFYSFEAPELYVGTSAELSPVQIGLGRKLQRWSKLDEQWQLGLWQPRFRWDALYPEEVGLAGLFLEVKQPWIQATFFASPGFVPERGAPLALQGDSFVAYSPFVHTPPSTMNVMGIPHNVRYSIDMPSYSDLLLKPGAAAQVRIGQQLGAWGSAGYAYKPMNQVFLAFDPYVTRRDSSPEVNVTLHPRVLYQHLYAIEGGFEQKQYGIWGSFTHEKPVDPGVSETWDSQQAAVSDALAVGADWKPLAASLSYLHQSGGNAPDQGPEADGVGTRFENRYPFQDAVSLALAPRYRAFGLYGRLLADLGNSGWLLSGAVDYAFGRGWKAKLAGDLLISSSSGTDLISMYRGNDRISAGVSYAF